MPDRSSPLILVKKNVCQILEPKLRQDGFTAGLFNAHYRPVYERLTAGSRAAVQSASAMFVAPLARAILSALLRNRAMMPGLTRMRLASSARVTSRTQWFLFSIAQ